MRKKIILRLFLLIVFSISLYSCVHDEIASSTDPSSKEYTNKSLWKQDEKYIKNVMKVYYEHEAEIKKVGGTPYWDYASSMESFDESFVMVPIVDQGKVVSILQVPRDGATIHFYYTNFRNQIDFFQKLVFSEYKKALPSETSSPTSKLTICTRQSISVWLPNDESNPEAGGHWQTSTIIKCVQHMDQCVGVVNANGVCEGGGGGGYPYPGGDDPQDPEESEDPCAKTKAIVNKPQIKAKLASLQQHAVTNTKVEDGFQELKSGTLQTGTVTADNQMFFGIGENSLGTVHTHQPKTIGIFAPQDIMTFLAIVRKQDANSLGNAYSGTVSSIGTYFINFTGTASDLPTEMTNAQEEAYVAKLVEIYKSWEDFLSQDDKYSTNNLKVNKPQGLEILLFKLLKQMNLDDKIQLIKENGGNTSTIKENSDGTTTPNPC